MILPMDEHLPQMIRLLRACPVGGRSLVLAASPGAGKTTRVPPAILQAGILSAEHPNIVMLQPRRVAARSVAARIADENDWQLGQEVGYHVRFDRKMSRDTRLRVLTEGILTRQLVDDPFLPGIGCVILDEFHERSLHSDIGLALLREIQQTVREDLILLVMSATLDVQTVANYLGQCPTMQIDGRTFPVDIHQTAGQYRRLGDQLTERVYQAVTDVLDRSDSLSESGRDILVFLPGVEEIRRVAQKLEMIQDRQDVVVMPLHGSLPLEQQNQVLKPARKRKIILSTNIAETSLTIDGVGTVIDSGLAKVAHFDAHRGLDRLDLERISRASATQRAGRAGRTAPGICVRLWSEQEQKNLDAYETPEIHRVDLCNTVLTLYSWGVRDPRQFNWFDSPPEKAIASSEQLLIMLGALNMGNNQLHITDIGRQLLSLPVHPRLGRLLIAAALHGLISEAATIAALLSEKDILLRSESGGYDARYAQFQKQPHTQGVSDVLMRLAIVQRASGNDRNRDSGNNNDSFSNYDLADIPDANISHSSVRQVLRIRDDLLRVARNLPIGKNAIATEEELLKLVLWAYPDRVCRRRGESDRAVMVGGSGVKMSSESIVTKAEFFVAVEARQERFGQGGQAAVRIASGIQEQWLSEMFRHEIRKESGAFFEPQRSRVVGRTAIYYRDLLLQEDCNAAVDPASAAAAFALALQPLAIDIFKQNESATMMMVRLAFLVKHMPEHPWPELSAQRLAEILVENAGGRKSVDEIKQLPLAALLKNELHYPLDRLFEEHAPESIEVPTGNQIKVAYSENQPPVLAVRLQECFGWTDTPKIAGGRVSVVMHLLGPNYRPVQITDDLRSFWSGTYFQVRKDLRVRYPKHSWPEEPLLAKPVARGRNRKT